MFDIEWVKRGRIWRDVYNKHVNNVLIIYNGFKPTFPFVHSIKCVLSVFVPIMATGHILPGYGDPVTRLRRVQSVGCYMLDSTTLRECEKAACLSQEEFSQIRESARQLWKKQCPQITTYETYFSDGKIREMTQPRPTSRDRRNNPHPTQWV